jgi:hypothetical protein
MALQKYLETCMFVIIKGGLISESFFYYFDLNLPNRGAESLSWSFSLSVDCAQAPLFEIWAKEKNFLKLSHL